MSYFILLTSNESPCPPPKTLPLILPLCIVTVSNGAISSIDQVFNGAGYIGHHAFVLPDVKVLAPNGLNDDGTLKSVTCTQSVVSIIEMTTQNITGYSKGVYLEPGGRSYNIAAYREVNTIAERDSDTTNYRTQYVCENNTIYTHTNNGYETRTYYLVLFYNYNGTSVTKFDVRPVSGLSGSYINTALGYTPERQDTIQTLSATASITLADNTIYNGGEQTALTIALPATADVSFICEIDFTSGTTPSTLAYPNSIKWFGTDVSGGVFVPTTSTRYTLLFYFDGVHYVCIVKGIV